MARTLTIVAGAGIAISAVCLGLAAAIAGDDIWDLRIPGWGFDTLDPFVRDCDDTNVAPFAGTTREIAWHGDDDEVTISVPGTATYTPGSGTALIATGSPEALAHLRVQDGHIEFDCSDPDFEDELNLTLPGRPFSEFIVSNSGSLVLQDLRQDELEISIGGAGTIRATGTSDDVELNIGGSGEAEFAGFITRDLQIRIGGAGEVLATGSAEQIELVIGGSGNADLGGMPTRRAEITIAGSGDASIAPSDEASVTIAGSGNVRLLRQPERLETRIIGSGNIVNAPATAPSAPAAPAEPAVQTP